MEMRDFDGFFDMDGLDDVEKKAEFLRIAKASATFGTLREVCKRRPQVMEFILAVLSRLAVDLEGHKERDVIMFRCAQGVDVIASEIKKNARELREESKDGVD